MYHTLFPALPTIMQHYDRKLLASMSSLLWATTPQQSHRHSGHDRPLVEQKHNLSRSGCCCGEEKKEEECPWVFLFLLRFAAVEAKLQSTLGKLFSVDFFLPYLTKKVKEESPSPWGSLFSSVGEASYVCYLLEIYSSDGLMNKLEL